MLKIDKRLREFMKNSSPYIFGHPLTGTVSVFGTEIQFFENCVFKFDGQLYSCHYYNKPEQKNNDAKLICNIGDLIIEKYDSYAFLNIGIKKIKVNFYPNEECSISGVVSVPWEKGEIYDILVRHDDNLTVTDGIFFCINVNEVYPIFSVYKTDDLVSICFHIHFLKVNEWSHLKNICDIRSIDKMTINKNNDFMLGEISMMNLLGDGYWQTVIDRGESFSNASLNLINTSSNMLPVIQRR